MYWQWPKLHFRSIFLHSPYLKTSWFLSLFFFVFSNPLIEYYVLGTHSYSFWALSSGTRLLAVIFHLCCCLCLPRTSEHNLVFTDLTLSTPLINLYIWLPSPENILGLHNCFQPPVLSAMPKLHVRGKRKDKLEASSTMEQRRRPKAKVSSDSIVYKDMRLMEVLLKILTLSEQDAFYALIWHTGLWPHDKSFGDYFTNWLSLVSSPGISTPSTSSDTKEANKL